jgi:hypothetical protein
LDIEFSGGFPTDEVSLLDKSDATFKSTSHKKRKAPHKQPIPEIHDTTEFLDIINSGKAPNEFYVSENVIKDVYPGSDHQNVIEMIQTEIDNEISKHEDQIIYKFDAERTWSIAQIDDKVLSFGIQPVDIIACRRNSQIYKLFDKVMTIHSKNPIVILAFDDDKHTITGIDFKYRNARKLFKARRFDMIDILRLSSKKNVSHSHSDSNSHTDSNSNSNSKSNLNVPHEAISLTIHELPIIENTKLLLNDTLVQVYIKMLQTRVKIIGNVDILLNMLYPDVFPLFDSIMNSPVEIEKTLTRLS